MKPSQPLTPSDPRTGPHRRISGDVLLRPRPAWLVALTASLLAVAALALLSLNTDHHDVVGVGDAVAVLVAVLAAVVSGPWVGLVVALVGGVSFYGFISDFGRTSPVEATVVSIVAWVLSAIVAGAVAERLRAQQAARREAQNEASLLHEQLEAGLLPRLASVVGPLEVVWRYLPSERRLGVSGDFYDVAVAPDGRAAAVVGDVIGHGPTAAALGATLRAGWYALVRSGASIDQIVQTLSDSVGHTQRPPDVLVTLCLVWFSADVSRATIVRLGHLPPLLLTDAEARELQTPGALPLGVDEGGSWETSVIDLPPTWGLMLYTDGLVEGRSSPRGSERYGLPRLLECLGRAAGEQSLDAVLEDVIRANGGPLPDDVAVLLVRPADAARRGAR